MGWGLGCGRGIMAMWARQGKKVESWCDLKRQVLQKLAARRDATVQQVKFEGRFRSKNRSRQTEMGQVVVESPNASLGRLW